MAVPLSRSTSAFETNGSASSVALTRFTQAWQVIFTLSVTAAGAIVSFSCLNLRILIGAARTESEDPPEMCFAVDAGGETL